MTSSGLDTVETHTASLPRIFRRYRADIDGAMRSHLSGDGAPVYDMLRYYMGWADVDGRACSAVEGKALRPTLCVFACEATGGSVSAAIPAAVALEFIHNFSLIHDDIQDRDETRHHRPTLWAVWGEPKALVAGNILRVVADRALGGLIDQGVRSDRALDAVGVLTGAYLEMIEGQYLDLSYEGRPDIGIDDYLDMISRKTGALIRSSLALGALIGSGNATTIEAFVECGRSLGHVFQIRDDVLGVWGEEKATGKPVGADIRRKKNSFPVVYAMSKATGLDVRSLKRIYAKDELDDRDVEAVLEIMGRVDARAYAESEALQHSKQALDAVAEVDLDPKVRRELEELVEFLLVRDY